MVVVATCLGICTLFGGAWQENLFCKSEGPALQGRIQDAVRVAGEAATDSSRHEQLRALRDTLDDKHCAARQLDRLLPTTHDWAYRGFRTSKVSPSFIDLTSLTGGENGYLAGWWSTRVAPRVPSFPPPQLKDSAAYELWCLYRGRMLVSSRRSFVSSSHVAKK